MPALLRYRGLVNVSAVAEAPIVEGGTPGMEWLRMTIEALSRQQQTAATAPGEGANAQLKAWEILTKLRCCPWRAGKLAKAIHVLQLHKA
jgi:hypothetical protein